MKLFLKFCIVMSCMAESALHAQEAIDLIIFSKNRPLQLYAFLESCERYISGINSLTVVFYADQPFSASYRTVKETFPYVHFKRQRILGTRGDFRKLTQEAVFATDAPYIIFAVDDIVVIDSIDMQYCAQLLEQYDAYGFYLRLGTEITHCYAESRRTGQPPLKLREHDVYSWRFCNGTGDWGYPNTVDMTLFRKKDIEFLIKTMAYHSPNTFEARWSNYAGSNIQRRGLCYTNSKIVNLPMNLVQNDFKNRHATEYDAELLLEAFQAGLKMDISPLHQFPHKAPHAEYKPTFIRR